LNPPQDAVARRIVELGAVDQPAVERRHDFAARQRIHGGAHFGVHVDRETDGAELHALHVLDLAIGFLNQPNGCVGMGPYR